MPRRLAGAGAGRGMPWPVSDSQHPRAETGAAVLCCAPESVMAGLSPGMGVSHCPLHSLQGQVLKYLKAFQQGERGGFPLALSP